MPLSAWSIWRLLRVQIACCIFTHSRAWRVFFDLLFISKDDKFGTHLQQRFLPSFELLGWTSLMNSSSKLFWPRGLFLMDSHQHQHLLETISKQPLGDTTLIFCTIDDLASSILFSQPQAYNLFPARLCVLFLRMRVRLCTTCHPRATAATLTTADITVHIEQHPVADSS